ncbi:PAS domain-containing protein [Methanobacterium aggregans]|uniref:PAS domain-containing protein n=2 Tax=Methanobacterium aggregans TaxID=1615586 RepID=UPI001AE7538D|nr:PAS domain-containing protein [Methanobacterium aggregans]MBP2045713.1 PAS domain S-box-containing protein [Methanobacterium aggregans]
MEIFEKSPIGLLLCDVDGKLVDANQSALKITGIPEDASDIDIFDTAFMAQKKETLLEEGSTRFQAPLDFENIETKAITTKSGELLIDWNISVLDSGFLVQIQEVTGSTSAEFIKENERYRRWFEEDLTGDFIATMEGKVIECNPAFADIYGFDNRELAVQSDISNFNPYDWETLIKRLKLEHKVHGHQSTHRRPDGKEIHVVSNLVGIFDDLGGLVQVKGYIFDDTERKKAEESLKRSEEKYHRLFEEDLTGDFIATLDGRVLDCNPAFAEIYGFDNREKSLKSDISQFDPDDWVNLISSLKDEGKIQDHQRWHRRPDGKEIHVVSNLVGIFDDLGGLVQVKGYIFDDTERKKAEESLKRSEEKYHRLFEEDLTGDFIAAPNGEILECNPAFAEIYGFDDYKTALQWNISQSNSFDWPYMVTRLKREGNIKGFQSWQRRSDGLRIHVVANVVGIFDDLGELIQVKGYIFNDTERKQAEEKLANAQNQIKKILDSIQDGFFALNSYWNFIYVNQAAGEYFSAEPEDLVGENIWERFPELLGTNYETTFRRAMDEQETKYFEANDINGTGNWFGFSVYPSLDGISIYWRDINLKI